MENNTLRSQNSVVLEGHLVRTPEIRMSKTGMPIGHGSVAINHSKDSVSFFDFVTFETVTDVLKTLDKGHRVQISGYLKQNTWTDPEGKKRSKVEIIVKTLTPMERKQKPVEEPTCVGIAEKAPDQDLSAVDDEIPF